MPDWSIRQGEIARQRIIGDAPLFHTAAEVVA